jgi:putative transposase
MGLLEKIRNQEISGYLTTKKRIVYPGAVYHITQRAPGREIIFAEESDYLKFLSELKKTVKRFSLNLFCFSLLENHLHLLLQIKDKNLSEAMQILFGKYAAYYNYKYKRKGHVFCGRFRSSLVNHDNYLLAASCYIHLNPYNAGLTEYFDKYRWSSLSLYAKSPKRTFVNYEKILTMIDDNLHTARKKYLGLLKQSTEIKGGKFIDAKKIKRFVEKTKVEVIKINKKESELDLMIEKFKKTQRVKTPKEKKARKYLIEQLISNGNSITEIADLLHLSRQTIHKTIKPNS